MIELDHRAEQFLESIREEGHQACAAVAAETDKSIAAELERTRAAEEARSEKTLAFETARAETARNRTLSAARAAQRAQLSARRDALVAEVFADARARLEAFAAGDGYAAWLGQSAAALAARLGAGTVLYARPADAPLLAGSLPAGCTLKPDTTIALGGLRAENGDLFADDTLENRLAAQKDWFLENSGLTVTV